MVSPEEAFQVLLQVTRVLDELDVPASPEDTILQKLLWYQKGGGVSERQWNDILGVIKIQGRALDLRYLKDWAERSGIDALLARVLADAGLD